MKINLLSFIFAIASVLSLAQTNQKVLIFGVDGCRSDALQVANTPNIDALIYNGFYSPDALNDDITISGPGWSNILTGVRSPKHQVFNNNFSGNNYVNYPSVFKLINDYNPDFHTVAITHWEPLNDYLIQAFADFELYFSDDNDVTEYATNYLNVNSPDLMFLHFDDVDHAGHSSGFSPSNSSYINAIEGVDDYIGEIMQAVQNRIINNNENWLILLISDHGGSGTSHGGTSIVHRNIAFIASGDSIPLEILKKDSNFYTPTNCLNDTVELSFENSTDYVYIPNNMATNFGSNQDFTVECRVKTTLADDVAIIGNKDWDEGDNAGFVFSFKFSSGPEWKVNIGDGSNRVDLNTGGHIADNEWHTLSVSFDRDGFMKMYEDGTLIDSSDISSVGDIDIYQGLFFGADVLADYNYNGSIAEVRIWNSIIEANEIQNWFCTTINNTHQNYLDLVGYWQLNEGSGNIAYDSSSTANNGTIINSSWNNSTGFVDYDYSSTPRLVDVVPTLLTHLCIPIDTAWELEGISRIEEQCIFDTIINPIDTLYINDTIPIIDTIHINGAIDTLYIYDTIYTTEPIDTIYRIDTLYIHDTIDLTSLKTFEKVDSKYCIYPNPTKDFITIKNLNNNYFSFKIIDLLGEELYQSEMLDNRITINLMQENIYSGIYLFQIKEGEKIEYHKFIVF